MSLPLLLSSLALSATAARQDYVVTGREDQLWSLTKEYFDYRSGNITNGMASIVSFSASEDEQLVVVDHWEDGFEADPLNPVQTTTLRFVLDKGQSVTLASDQSGASTQCVPSAFTATSPAECRFNAGGADPRGTAMASCVYHCSAVPVSGRSVMDLRFDSGDLISTIGGDIALVHELYPRSLSSSEEQLLAAVAVEHFSKQTLGASTSYRIPVGQNAVNPPPTGPDPSDPFFFARVMVTAFSNDTTVTLDNGTAMITITLDKGETYTSSNAQGTGAKRNDANAPNLRLVAGTRVEADKEVAIVIANGGSGTYHLDMSAALPVHGYGYDFVIPTSPTAAASTPHRLYLYNPNAVTANVSYFLPGSSVAGTTTTISANSSATVDVPLTDGYPTAGRVRSDAAIWGFVTSDVSGSSWDYSYALMPSHLLAREYVLPNTPNANGGASGGNAIAVVPLEDNTKISVFYPGDDDADVVDVDCDGAIDGDEVRSCVLSPLGIEILCTTNTGPDCETTSLGCDPAAPSYTLRTRSSSYDAAANKNSVLRFCGGALTNLAGTRIVASAPVMVVYAPDPAIAAASGPVDFGFTLVPGSSATSSDFMRVSLGATPATLPLGSIGALDLQIAAGTRSGAVQNVDVLIDKDALLTDPPQATFVDGAGAHPITGQMVSFADAFGRSTFRFDVSALLAIGAGQTLNASLPIRQAENVSTPTEVEAYAVILSNGRTLRPDARFTLRRSPLSIAFLAPTAVIPSQAAAITLSVKNAGAASESNVHVYFPVPEGARFVSATGATCNYAAGTGELDCTLGAIAAASAKAVSVNVEIQPLPTGTRIEGRARAVSSNAGSYAEATPFVMTVSTPTLMATAHASPSLVVKGGSLVIEVDIQNAGDLAATSGLLTLAIPSGMQFANLAQLNTGAGWIAATATASATQIALALGTLAPYTHVRARMRFNALASAPAGTYGFRGMVSSLELQSPTASTLALVDVKATPDVEAPVITLTAPSGDVGATPTLGGTARDASGVQCAAYRICSRSAGDTSCASPSGCSLTPPTTCSPAPATALTFDASFGDFSAALGTLGTGHYCVVVFALDGGGTQNVAQARSAFSVTVDTVAPSAPTVLFPTAGDTTAKTFVVRGIAEPQSTVSGTLAGAPFTTTADADGRWSFSAGPSSSGAKALVVTAKDASQNTSAPTNLSFSVDATAPDAPGIAGPSPAAVQPAFFTLHGTAEPMAAISGTAGALAFSSTADEQGNWQIGLGPFSDGALVVSITASDAYDNVSVATDTSFTVDASIPTAPMILAPLSGTTVRGSYVISGTAEPNAVIDGGVGGMSFQAVADAGGQWSYDVDTRVSGPEEVTVTATDAVGNQSPPAIGSFFVDATPPPTPSIDDTPRTFGEPIVITGSGEPYAMVMGELDGMEFMAVVDSDGKWSVFYTSLSAGTHTIKWRSRDAAGNESAEEERTFTVTLAAAETPGESPMTPGEPPEGPPSGEETPNEEEDGPVRGGLGCKAAQADTAAWLAAGLLLALRRRAARA